jgi:hypothetical protein
METNTVGYTYNCTQRFIKFMKDKKTIIILYTNTQAYTKAKDEGSSLLGRYTMFIRQQLPTSGRIVSAFIFTVKQSMTTN